MWSDRIASYLAGAAIAVFVLALRPFCVVLLGWVDARQIGHMETAHEDFIRVGSVKNTRGRRKVHVLWQIFGPASNPALLTIIRKKLKIRVSVFGVRSAHALFKRIGLRSFLLTDSGSGRLDTFDKALASGPFLSFVDFGSSSSMEEMVQRQFDGRPIISLHIRDGAYKREAFSDFFIEHEEEDFRDITAGNYVPMIEQAIAQGYAVIRVGSHAQNKLPVHSDFFLDYPFSSYVSPMNDLHVIGISSAYVAGGESGLMYVALMMQKPVFFSNSIIQRLPINAAPALAIFRPHIKASTGQPWRLSELSQILSNAPFYPQFQSDFIGLDIQFGENTSAEIADAFAEFLDLIQNPLVRIRAVTPREKAFWHLYPPGPNWDNLPRRTKIGCNFLERNPLWSI